MDEADRLMFEGWATLPQFKRKVEQARSTIREGLSIAPAYVSVSWGKDSTVLLHLCQQEMPDIPVISFGHPERELIDNYAEVEKAYLDRYSPKLTTIEIVGDHVPAKVQQSKLWQQYSVAFVGLRKEESKKRSIALSKYGLMHQFQTGGRSGSWRVCPLGWWNWKDVWAYTVIHALPYLKSYDRTPKDRGRTTDHFTKSADKTWQRRRLEEFATINPTYYHHLRSEFPEMFF